MSDPTVGALGARGLVHVESLEAPDTTQSREIVRDEDVLSAELRQALESVGSSVGVIAALALVFSQLPRARTLIGGIAGKGRSAGEQPGGKVARDG